MDRYDTGLMKLLRERDNRDPDEARIGKIIALDPIKVSLFGGAAIFTEDDINAQLYVCESLKGIAGKITIDNQVQKSFSINRDLGVNDKVLCIPISNGQAYVAVDRV